MPAAVAKHTELFSLIPYGFLAARHWLLEQGVSNHTLDNQIKSGQLVALAPGVYRRPDSTLKWQSVISSLQRMGHNLVVGGLTALEEQGFAHYLPLGAQREIHVYGDALPTWVNDLGLPAKFTRHSVARLFEAAMLHDAFTAVSSLEGNGWSLRQSTPERALLEVLDDVPELVSFEHADQLMEGLFNLSPRRLDALLRQTRSVKVKRLFFWLAGRQQHAWLSKLKPDDYNLGSGKRVLVKGGKLDPTYQITVPKEMHG